jgi:ABC-type antimicrobial peptide transport system permease subunit
MDIPIINGRSFQDADMAETAERAYIINETLARTHLPGEDPIGKKIVVVEAPKPYTVTIIGVTADTKDLGVDRQIEPEIFGVGFSSTAVLFVHSEGNPLALTSTIRESVKSIDPYQPVGEVRTLKSVVDDSLADRKILATLMSLFSALGLVLSAIGIYGVMSYSVVQRTAEIGIRMALGATRSDIVKLLMQQALRPVTIGVAVGLIAAWSFRRVLAGLLQGVSSTDIPTYALVAALTLLTAAAATLIPSRRAGRIDPQIALRDE